MGQIVASSFLYVLEYSTDVLSSVCRSLFVRWPVQSNHADRRLLVIQPAARWDKGSCAEYEKMGDGYVLGLWCCKDWCYVPEECPSAAPSAVGKDLFYSSARKLRGSRRRTEKYRYSSTEIRFTFSMHH